MMRRLRTVGRYCFVFFLLATALCWSARWFWVGEMMVSLSWAIGWAGVIGAALLMITRSRRSAIVVLLLGLMHLTPQLMLWLPGERSGPLGSAVMRGRSEFLLATANLDFRNLDHDGLREWLAENDPELIVCSEVTIVWRRVLEEQSARYPYQVFSPKDGVWSDETRGNAILSKLPFRASRLIEDGTGETRTPIEVVIAKGGRVLTIVGVHPTRPGTGDRVARRNATLEVLKELEWSGNSALLGDLNTVSSSPAFGDLIAASGLRDSRQSFGRQATFELPRTIPGFWIAIDHVLVGERVHVLDRTTPRLRGSDHLPVLVRLAVE